MNAHRRGQELRLRVVPALRAVGGGGRRARWSDMASTGWSSRTCATRCPTSAVVQEPPGPPYERPAVPRGAAAAGPQGLRGHRRVLPARRARGPARPAPGRRRAVGPWSGSAGTWASARRARPTWRERAAIMEEVVSTLEPDGIFLVLHPLPGLLGAVDAGDAAVRDRRVLLLRAVPGALRRGDGARAAGRAHRGAERGHPARAARRLDGLEVRRHRRGHRDAARRGAARCGPGVEVLHQRRGPGAADYGNAVSEVLGQSPEAIGARGRPRRADVLPPDPAARARALDHVADAEVAAADGHDAAGLPPGQGRLPGAAVRGRAAATRHPASRSTRHRCARWPTRPRTA